MKRNQNKPTPAKTLQSLEKKYEQERDIRQHQIRRLEKILEKNIQEKKMSKLQHEKREQMLQNRIQGLVSEIERMRNQVMRARGQEMKEDDKDEQEHLGLLRQYKQAIQNTRQLQEKVAELMDQVVIIDQEKSNVQLRQQEQRIRIEHQDQIIKTIKGQMYEIQKKEKELIKESKLLGRELQSKNQRERELYEQVTQLEQDMAQTKKRKKGMEKDIDRLQQQLKHFQSVEAARLENQISELKRDREELQQNGMKIGTKVEFLQIAVRKKQEYIIKFQQEVKETREVHQQQKRELQGKVDELQKHRRVMQTQLQTEKANAQQKLAESIQELNKKHEEQIENLKKKMVDQVFGMLNKKQYAGTSQQENRRTFEHLFEGARNCKSYGMIPNDRGRNQEFLHSYGQQTQPEPYKLQAQLQNLRAQLITSKRQNEILATDTTQLKKTIQSLKSTYQTRIKTLEDFNSKLQKSSKNLGNQLLQLRNQNILLREKQSQLMHQKQQNKQFENEMSLKISFYDKKIRDLLEAIERKEQVIGRQKDKRGQMEQKVRFFQEKAGKLIEENEGLKKFKSDYGRKESLVKEYKEKIQKLKTEVDTLKNESEVLKREKIRLEKNIQSKQQYTNILKAKHQKELTEVQAQQKQLKAVKEKEQKNIIDSKNKKLKKECNQHLQALQQIRDTVCRKVQQKLAKSIPENKKKKTEWQGAKLLGLKSSQVQEFINPVAGMDKSIGKDLEEMWKDGCYSEFVETALEYLFLKG